jgi:very-short-patch-repair endonuclease
MELQYKCKFCNKLCKKYGLKNHESTCKLNPERDLNRVVHSLFTCKICKTEFISKHELYEHKKKVHTVYTNGGQKEKYELTCKYCGIVKYTNRSIMTRHELCCDKNPNKIPYKGHNNTKEIRKRISLGMKKAHKEGRASSWIGRRKLSYAEQSWFNIFTNEKIKFENNYYVKPYWLDFAWPDKKLYFEVDGKTHFTDNGKLHDEKRTKFLQEQGWILIGRCNWSEYQSFSVENKEKYIKEIINKIYIA